MAATVAAAFAKVEGPALDALVYEVRRPEPPPVDPELDASLDGVDYADIRRIVSQLARRTGTCVADAEEATFGLLPELFEKHRDWLAEGSERWMGWLYKTAFFRLIDIRRGARRAESIEALRERAGDAALDGARPCYCPSAGNEQDSRHEPMPGVGEEWSPAQIIGALQRFGDHYARPPKASDCRPLHLLPGSKTINRQFGSLPKALLAAGMDPKRLDHPRRPRKAVESAKACRSFRWRNWRWPDPMDARRDSGELPSGGTMTRWFGGTRSAEVQQGAEAILAAVEAVD